MTLNSIRDKGSVITSGLLAIVCVSAFGLFLRWDSLTFTVKVADLTSLLVPLALAAAVVERSVEILISPWRDADACKLEKSVAAVKTSNPNDQAALEAASDALDEYRGQTKRYAFAVSLTVSALVSIAGVRSLQPFVDGTKFHNSAITSHAQQLFFLCTDVILSAALLAGGADGIHSVVNAVTSFFDASAARTRS